MGQHMTKSDKMMVIMLRRQLAKSGFQVAEEDMKVFTKFLKEVSPWFLEEGTLTLDDWKRVGREMRRHVKDNGEKTLPKYAYQIWYQIRELLTDTTPFEGLCRDTASDLGYEVGEEDGTIEEKMPLSKPNAPFPSACPPLGCADDGDDDWGLDDQQEEAEWEDDFRDHHPPRVAMANLSIRPRPVPKPQRRHMPPVGFQGALAEARQTGDTSLGIFPVVETGDNDEPVWEPLPLKTLKELQLAVKSLGPTAPYTLQVLDMVASLWLTPHDWMQTAKATLSPGDYILWRTEYEDKNKDTIVQSIKKRHPKPTMPMLMGTGEYADPQAQVKLPRDILTLITTNAVTAWRKLPPPGTKGGALASIRQGNEEPYQDFISKLEEAINRMLPPSEGTDILLKQLAWENANALCQDLIRPIRKTGTIQDYIKACSDASPAIVQGMAYAAAMKGQKFSAYVKRHMEEAIEAPPNPHASIMGSQDICKRIAIKARKGVLAFAQDAKKGSTGGMSANQNFIRTALHSLKLRKRMSLEGQKTRSGVFS